MCFVSPEATNPSSKGKRSHVMSTLLHLIILMKLIFVVQGLTIATQSIMCITRIGMGKGMRVAWMTGLTSILNNAAKV